MAEAANFWRGQRLWRITQHGGRMAAGGDGKMCMNVCSSDGGTRAIMDWTNPNQWEWSDLNYWPSNERTGDMFSTSYPGDIWDWSDAAFGFWTSFDRELYDGAAMPWGEGFWPPMWWHTVR